MDHNYYKNCIVPQCKNNSIMTPTKIFIHVPKNEQIRKKWLQLARRDPNMSYTSRMYFCEDHFDLPNDMENYMKYHVMGSVPQIRMKPGCLPSNFDCQPDGRKRVDSNRQSPDAQKKQRLMIVDECLNEYVMSRTSDINAAGSVSRDIITTSPDFPQHIPELRTTDKSIQVLITNKYRSKAIQANVKLRNKASSPLNFLNKSVSTSPFKIKYCMGSRPSGSHKMKVSEDNSDSDSLYKLAITHTDSSQSVKSLHMKSSSDCSELIEEIKTQKLSEALQNTINRILNKPRLYIGVPKSCYFLVDYISELANIPSHHILLCLKKIRLDYTFQELADDFGMTLSYASKIFLKNIPKIASLMRPFIVKIDSELNTKTLPIAFRHKFHNVSCIIDCLEIEIKKPSKAVHQALTWSDYKKANTIKYLISCTPGGLVNYISPGFGGRTTDTCLVESCDFIQCLDKGMCVMADRGFKHIEQYLQKSEVHLVRPPSTKTGCKLNKSEVKQTKQIASLRIHVERVIRRIREFNMLKPHACLNLNFLKILDDIVTIACGLINLQNSLIK